MKRALAHPTFRWLYLAQIMGLVASGLASVALGLLAFDLAGPRASSVLGTALAVKMIAYVAVSPLASAFLGHRDPSAVLIGANVVRLAVAGLMAFVDAEWQIYLLIFVLQASSACFTPTLQALLPRILPDADDYTAALSLSRLAYDLEQIVTPSLAALALLWFPGPRLFVVVAVAFCVATLIVAALKLPAASALTADTSWWPRATLGVKLLWTRRPLRPILALNAVVACGGAVVIIQSVVIVKARWQQGDSTLALLLAVAGLGSMVVALTLPRLLRRYSERPVMLGGAAAMPLVVLAVVGALRWPGAPEVAVGACWLAIGALWSMIETPVGRLLAAHLTDEERPAGFAGQFALSHACWLVAYPLCGWLGTWNLEATLVTLAALATVCAAGAWAWWPGDPVNSMDGQRRRTRPRRQDSPSAG